MKKVVIVAPTFNEAESIEKFIAQVLAQKNSFPDYELQLLVSDSHSLDRTSEIVERMSKKNSHIHYFDSKVPGPGKLGQGLVAGIDFAINSLKADLLITIEADLTEDPSQIPDFLQGLNSADVVVGSRYVRGGKIVNWTWWRRMFSFGANLMLRLFAGWPEIHEFTNLYRAFNVEAWQKIKPKIKMHTGWLFVPAFVFESLGLGLQVTELPIVYSDRLGGRSKMKTLSYTKNLLHYALRFRLNKILRR